MFHQFGRAGIVDDVKANPGKYATGSFLIAQDVIVRLMLKTMRTQRRAKVFSQKFHTVALIGTATQPHPNQVQVIGHQAISRTEQPLPHGGVQHYFPKTGVEASLSQPVPRKDVDIVQWTTASP